MKIVICDDLAQERERLIAVLQCYFQNRGEPVEIAQYGVGEALAADVEEDYLTFDLAFLDIYMERMNGIETARRLRQMGMMAPIIFLTATSEFAVESYDVHAAGYLLKPLDKGKLYGLLDYVLRPVDRRRISLKCRGQHRYFYIDEIVWVSSEKHTVTLHMQDGKQFFTSEKLNDIEALIDDRRFLRSHQSFLVNMDYIADVQEDFILRDGTRVPIRVRSRKQLTDFYREYFVSQAISSLPGGDAYV